MEKLIKLKHLKNIIENEIKKILVKINPDCKKITPNTDLIAGGFIDSFGFLILVSELEKSFKKKINTIKYNTSEFRSINTIKKIIKNS